MPDSKITALASIGTGTDPANDPLVIVDVSDVSPSGMSATGTTKKVTLNNLLACSPTATLASATITGDLTVRTNKLAVTSTGVGFGTASPATSIDVASGNLQVRTGGSVVSDTYTNYGAALSINAAGSLPLRLQIGGTNAYEITSGNIHTWSNVGGVGGTAMTLNSTGLGIGGTPVSRLTVSGGVSLTSAASNHFLRDGTAWIWSSDGASTGTARGGIYADGSSVLNLYGGSTLASHLLINSSGNVISNVTGTAPTLAANSQMVFNLTSNTNLRISVRGTDGTTRTANITLA